MIRFPTRNPNPKKKKMPIKWNGIKKIVHDYALLPKPKVPPSHTKFSSSSGVFSSNFDASRFKICGKYRKSFVWNSKWQLLQLQIDSAAVLMRRTCEKIYKCFSAHSVTTFISIFGSIEIQCAAWNAVQSCRLVRHCGWTAVEFKDCIKRVHQT